VIKPCRCGDSRRPAWRLSLRSSLVYLLVVRAQNMQA
jgi:hypothetical protein